MHYGPVSTPPSRLAELLSSTPVELDRVMAIVASVAPEPPTEDAIVGSFDQLAMELKAEVTAEPSAEEVLGHVYGRLGFVGDVANYYSPSNSFIHRVLERRRGIPLTLAAVGVEVGRRVGVELSIVGLPGHVILGDGAEPRRWFDPFAGGAELDVDGCRRLFARFHPIEQFDPGMLAPMPAAATAIRMLTNLKLVYRRSGDLGQMIRVLELSTNVPGAPPSERVELATLLAALGREDQAAEQRDLLAKLDPNRADAHRLAARRHRARRN